MAGAHRAEHRRFHSAASAAPAARHEEAAVHARLRADATAVDRPVERLAGVAERRAAGTLAGAARFRAATAPCDLWGAARPGEKRLLRRPALVGPDRLSRAGHQQNRKRLNA